MEGHVYGATSALFWTLMGHVFTKNVIQIRFTRVHTSINL